MIIMSQLKKLTIIGLAALAIATSVVFLAQKLNKQMAKNGGDITSMVFGGETNYGTVCLGEEGNTAICRGGAKGTIVAATSSGAWPQNVADEVWVDYVEMTPSANASSTMYYSVGIASSTALRDYGQFSTQFPILIASTTVATSTRPVITNTNWPIQATTTVIGNPSDFKSGTERLSFGSDTGTAAQVSLGPIASTSVRVGRGDVVVFNVAAQANTCAGNDGSQTKKAAGNHPRSCDSATSTTRQTVFWKLFYHY